MTLVPTPKADLPISYNPSAARREITDYTRSLVYAGSACSPERCELRTVGCSTPYTSNVLAMVGLKVMGQQAVAAGYSQTVCVSCLGSDSEWRDNDRQVFSQAVAPKAAETTIVEETVIEETIVLKDLASRGLCEQISVKDVAPLTLYTQAGAGTMSVSLNGLFKPTHAGCNPAIAQYLLGSGAGAAVTIEGTVLMLTPRLVETRRFTVTAETASSQQAVKQVLARTVAAINWGLKFAQDLPAEAVLQVVYRQDGTVDEAASLLAYNSPQALDAEGGAKAKVSLSRGPPFLNRAVRGPSFSITADPDWGKLASGSYSITVKLGDEQGRRAEPSTYRLVVTLNVTATPTRPLEMTRSDSTLPRTKSQASNSTAMEKATKQAAQNKTSTVLITSPKRASPKPATSKPDADGADLPVFRAASTMSDAEFEDEVFLGENRPATLGSTWDSEAGISESEEAVGDEDLETGDDAIDLASLEIIPGGCSCPSRAHQLGRTRRATTATACSMACSVNRDCAMFAVEGDACSLYSRGCELAESETGQCYYREGSAMDAGSVVLPEAVQRA